MNIRQRFVSLAVIFALALGMLALSACALYREFSQVARQAADRSVMTCFTEAISEPQTRTPGAPATWTQIRQPTNCVPIFRGGRKQRLCCL